MGIRNLVKVDEPWFMDEIEAHFAKIAAGDRKSPLSGYFRPSSITLCARCNMYVYLGVEFPPPDTDGMRRMMRGTRDHESWYEIFKKAGVKVRGGDNTKTRVSMKNPTTAGHYDFIATDSLNIDWLIEHKSTDIKTVSWEQLVQWCLYSVMTDIPRGYILKQSPSNWTLHPVKMERNEGFVTELLDWLRMTEYHALNKKMLERDDNCGLDRRWGETCGVYEFCHSPRGEHPW